MPFRRLANGYGVVMTGSRTTARRSEIQERLKELAVNAARAVAKRYLMEECQSGYKSAADVSLAIVTAKVDDLMRRMASGKKLSASEQDLLSSLNELKSEMQNALEAEWEVVVGDYR